MAGAASPSLFVGKPTHVEAELASTPREALSIIKAGGTAWFPEYQAALAVKTLTLLGVSQLMAEKQVHGALHGLGEAFEKDGFAPWVE